MTNVVQYDSNFNLSIGTSTSSSFNSSGSIIAASGFTGSLSGSVFGLGNTVSFSSSVSSRLTNIETKSSSVDISISNINTFTASNANTSLNAATSSYSKLTGGNTFTGTQIISASVYVQGDLIVQGSSSIQYISASSVSIGTNIVQLNTATPAVRFAGISVQDSGSSAGVTGSMLWDSLCNRWIYSNPSTIGYSGGMLLSGPRTSTLGTEPTLTCNYIAKSGGGDHLYDSCIIDDGTTICVNANLKGSGTISGTCIIVSSKIIVGGTSGDIGADLLRVKGTIITDNNAGYLGYSSAGNRFELAKISSGDEIVLGASNSPGAVALISGTGQDLILRSNGTCERMRITNCGNVGIGTTTAADLLHIEKFQAGGMGMVIRNACGATSNTSMCSLISLQLVGAGQSGQIGINLIAGKEGDYSSAGVRNAFFAIQTACGDNLYERMRITSDGRVGINVSPAASTIFHVQDNTARSAVYRLEPYTNAYESKLVISSRSSGDGGIRYGVGGGNDMNIFSYGTMRFNVGSGNISGNVTCERLNIDSNGIATFACAICTTKIGYNGYSGATAHDLVGHFDAGSTNIATLSGESAYTRVAAHIEWVTNYALAGTAMTMGYTIADTRRGNSSTIWVNCVCTILAYGDSPSNPTFGWSGGVLSVSVPGSHGLSARFRITTYAATLTPNI